MLPPQNKLARDRESTGTLLTIVWGNDDCATINSQNEATQ